MMYYIYAAGWDDNTDASLDITKMNEHNTYKDKVRTWEILARQAINKKKLNYQFKNSKKKHD